MLKGCRSDKKLFLIVLHEKGVGIGYKRGNKNLSCFLPVYFYDQKTESVTPCHPSMSFKNKMVFPYHVIYFFHLCLLTDHVRL